jgi:hypothetical protein
MSTELVEQLSSAQKTIEPQLKALSSAAGALKQAIKIAGEEHPDALAMQKALAKLQQANGLLDDESLHAATESFTSATETALDALAFRFARDLKETFEQRGQNVEGRPPTLVVDPLLLQIDIANRKAQWFYGKEELTRPIPLSIPTIVQAYDKLKRSIVERKLDVPAFVAELHKAWSDVLAKRNSRGGRANLVEVYSQLVLNRQSPRFWNAPSRSAFKDYERHFFVADLMQAHNAPTVEVDGQTQQLRLGVATKSQADSASRSIWLPHSALDGEYYATLTFQNPDGE